MAVNFSLFWGLKMGKRYVYLDVVLAFQDTSEP